MQKKLDYTILNLITLKATLAYIACGTTQVQSVKRILKLCPS